MEYQTGINMNYPQFSKLKKNEEIFDLYICSLGFEDRSLGSNNHLIQKKIKAKHTLVIRYDENVDENESKKDDFENSLKKISPTFTYVEYSFSNPDKFVKRFTTILKKYKTKPESVIINITSFVTYVLLTTINYSFDNFKHIKIIYTSPKKYSIQTKNAKSFASGVKKIFTVKGFTGSILPGYGSLLIMLLGYDIIRSRGILHEIQPAKKIAIMPKPTTKKMNAEYLKNKNEHRKSIDSKKDFIEFTIFDIKGIIEKLGEIRTTYIETHNIMLSLNGSKLHAIASILFAKKYSDIQLLLSTPIEYYPKSYSNGTSQSFEITFEREWLQEFFFKQFA